MLTLRRGRVTAVVESVEGLTRVEVDDRPCVAYPRLTGPVEVGDEVIVNTQARELALGSGGFDVLYVNLTRGLELPAEAGAHVVKLPYTPGQSAVGHGEEGRTLPSTLSGLPVVCCSLHSQVAPVCAGIGTARRVAYVQLAGGALPVSLSDTLRLLRERGYLGRSIAVGACLDGEVECVSGASAFLWAAAEGFDIVVCAIGPGIVGTGTPFGHGGLAAAEAANTASALQGSPVLAVRASESDERDRHRGASHHARSVLELCLGEVLVPWPAGYDAPPWLDRRTEVDVGDWEELCADLPLSHMGRGPADDRLFFAAAFAAGRAAASAGG
ncbi:MAG: hypothetical protein QOF27_1568 [Gaiellaceae bacterium]|jgi:hypothetical protein|nr:hypothetical protein [Gaiellaceae bacterium]